MSNTPASNSTAFITGAASGIGRATAEALYQRGWTLALADINAAALHQLTVNWDQNRVHCYQLDVTDEPACRHAITDFSGAHHNRLDVLFNSAGILQIDRFEEISAERHQLIFDINVMGTIHCCQAAFPFLKNSHAARVINMSSASAVYGVPRLASYSASKFAVKGLTEALQIEWAEFGIDVCDVMPPFVNTHMLTSQQNSAPVLDKLGVNINAEDVVRTILQQVDKPAIHRPVSLQFKIAYWFSELLPGKATGAIMRLLHNN